jgi:hypothetical protein
MANLVTKSNTKKVLITFLVLFVVSILSMVFFKLNLGVDYMDATVISVQLDHEESLSSIEPKVAKYATISKIEKEGTGNFYFYFQNISNEDAEKIITNIKTDNIGVASAGAFEYFAARERALIQRSAIIIAFAILTFCIYFLANLKNFKFSFAQVLSLLISDLLVILVNVVLIGGLISVLGKFGVIMDNNFWSVFFLSLGVIMLYRLYEIIKVRMVIKTLDFDEISELYKKMQNIYWPEFVFISCFLGLVAFLPLTVLGAGMLASSVLIIYSILIALASVFYLKPFMQNQLLRLSNSKRIIKVRFLNKKW